ncbi:MAG: hypothetical protein KDA80_09565, partial [Planctomycetaceae bacterium]|nr:hypothetical protein [Planctomycetaceae bacterium]
MLTSLVVSAFLFLFCVLVGVRLFFSMQAREESTYTQREVEESVAGNVPDESETVSNANRFQLAWYRSMFLADDPIAEVLPFLENWQTGQSLNGWVVAENGEVIARTSEASDSIAGVVIPQEDWRALHHQSHALVTCQFRQFPEPGPVFSRTLEAFRIGSAERMAYVLLLSEVPQISGSTSQDRNLLGSVCQDLPSDVSKPRRAITATESEELALVREMLELRSLTDLNFSSPLQLLEEFLHKLAVLTEFERASLYLREDANPKKLTCFATGGSSQAKELNTAWSHAEEYWLEMNRESHLGCIRLTDSSLHGVPEEFLFRSGIQVPVWHDSEWLGCLVLTSQNARSVNCQDEELVKWAAEYLLKTLDKALDRAAIEEQARRDPLTNVANR